MNNVLKEKTAYNLFKKDRIYRDRTLSSIYFKPFKAQVEKKSCPMDIEGIRYKLNLVTGEISNYSKREVLNSISSSVRRTKILLNMLLEMNNFDWFCTLTFDKDKVDRTDDTQVFKTYVKYINNIKKQFPSLGYITIPERHEDSCIHFHILINGITPQQLGFVDSGKVCCSWAMKHGKLCDVCSKEYFEKTKIYHDLTNTDGLPVYNISSFPYGLTTASKVASRERCNTYVKKYIEKALGSTDIFKKRFYYSKNLKVPSIVEQLIGADFYEPKKLTSLELAKFDSVFKAAKYVFYNKDHNVLQYWVDNKEKSLVDSGIIPIGNCDLFDNQLEMNF